MANKKGGKAIKQAYQTKVNNKKKGKKKEEEPKRTQPKNEHRASATTRTVASNSLKSVAKIIKSNVVVNKKENTTPKKTTSGVVAPTTHRNPASNKPTTTPNKHKASASAMEGARNSVEAVGKQFGFTKDTFKFKHIDDASKVVDAHHVGTTQTSKTGFTENDQRVAGDKYVEDFFGKDGKSGKGWKKYKQDLKNANQENAREAYRAWYRETHDGKNPTKAEVNEWFYSKEGRSFREDNYYAMKRGWYKDENGNKVYITDKKGNKVGSARENIEKALRNQAVIDNPLEVQNGRMSMGQFYTYENLARSGMSSGQIAKALKNMTGLNTYYDKNGNVVKGVTMNDNGNLVYKGKDGKTHLARTKDGKKATSSYGGETLDAITKQLVYSYTEGQRGATGFMEGANFLPVSASRMSGADLSQADINVIEKGKNSKEFQVGNTVGLMVAMLASGAGGLEDAIAQRLIRTMSKKALAKQGIKATDQDIINAIAKLQKGEIKSSAITDAVGNISKVKKYGAHAIGGAGSTAYIDFADALRMSTDEYGNVNPQALATYSAMNVGLGGGMSAGIKGLGNVATKMQGVGLKNLGKTADAYSNVGEMMPVEMQSNAVGKTAKLEKKSTDVYSPSFNTAQKYLNNENDALAKNVESYKAGTDVSHTTPEIANTISMLREKQANGTISRKEQRLLTRLNENSATTTLTKGEAKEYIRLSTKESAGTLTAKEQARFSDLSAKMDVSVRNKAVKKQIDNINKRFKDLGGKINVEVKAGVTKDLDKIIRENGGGENAGEYGGFVVRNDDGSVKEIWVNADHPEAVNFTVGHELSHVMEVAGEQYEALTEMVKKFVGNDKWEEELANCMKAYDGVKNANPEKEAMANLIGDVLTADDKFLRQIVSKDKNLFEKIYDFIKKLCGNETDPENGLVKIKESCEKIMDDIGRGEFKGASFDTGKIDYMNLGAHALTANRKGLAQGIKDLRAGKITREELRTNRNKYGGWFQGKDGRWRFEIDDSRMGFAFKVKPPRQNVIKNIDNIEKEFLELHESRAKTKSGHFNGEKEKRYQTLKSQYSNAWLYGYTANSSIPLSAVVDNWDELFEAYPALKDVEVKISDLGDETPAFWSPNSSTGRGEIHLNSQLFTNPTNEWVEEATTRYAGKDVKDPINEYQKDSIVHEVQHAVQTIEGFANGGGDEMFTEIVEKSMNADGLSENDILTFLQGFDEGFDTALVQTREVAKNVEKDAGKLARLNKEKSEILDEMQALADKKNIDFLSYDDFVYNFRKDATDSYSDAQILLGREKEEALHFGKEAYANVSVDSLVERGIIPDDKEIVSMAKQWAEKDYDALVLSVDSPVSGYKSIVGEDEAYTTEARRKLTAKERKQKQNNPVDVSTTEHKYTDGNTVLGRKKTDEKYPNRLTKKDDTVKYPEERGEEIPDLKSDDAHFLKNGRPDAIDTGESGISFSKRIDKKRAKKAEEYRPEVLSKEFIEKNEATLKEINAQLEENKRKLRTLGMRKFAEGKAEKMSELREQIAKLEKEQKQELKIADEIKRNKDIEHPVGRKAKTEAWADEQRSDIKAMADDARDKTAERLDLEDKRIDSMTHIESLGHLDKRNDLFHEVEALAKRISDKDMLIKKKTLIRAQIEALEKSAERQAEKETLQALKELRAKIYAGETLTKSDVEKLTNISNNAGDKLGNPKKKVDVTPVKKTKAQERAEKISTLKKEIADEYKTNGVDAVGVISRADRGITKEEMNETARKQLDLALETHGGSEEFMKTISDGIHGGMFGKVDGKSAKEATAQATRELNDFGYDGLMQKYFDEPVYDPKIAVARARTLFEDIDRQIKAGDGDLAQLYSDRSRILEKISGISNFSARATQAMKDFMTATPEGRIRVVNREIERLQNKYKGKIKGGKLEIDKNMLDDLVRATGDEKDAILHDINIELWEQIPASFMEKMNEVRHAFMLFNAKTHLRNIIGNGLFRALRKISDDIIESSLYETKYVKGKLEELGGTADKTRVTKKEIRENIDYLASEWNATYKKSGSRSRYIEMERPDDVPVVKWKPMQKFIKLNYDLLEHEDLDLTLRPAFNKAYTSWCKTHCPEGKTISEFMAEMTDAQKTKARNYAMFEGEYATYRDTCAFSSWLTGKKQKFATTNAKTPFGTIGYRTLDFALEGALPFVKTPVNVFRRSVDFSPIGIVKGLGALYKCDNVDMFKYGIHQLSSGLTGTGVFGLGWFLASQDIFDMPIQLRTKAGEVYDENEDSGDAYYDRDMGKQDYSLEVTLPDGKRWSLSLDWASPTEMSLFMGATFGRTMDALFGGEGDFGTKSLNMLFSITSPMTDTSFMSSTKDTIQNFMERATREGESGEQNFGGAMAQLLLGDLPKNYIGGFVPQLVSQFAGLTDAYQRDTRGTSKNDIIRGWQSTGRQLINRVPYFRQKFLNKKVDRFGNDKTNGENIATRIINSIFNPATVKEINENETDRQLIQIRNHIKDKSSDEYKYFYYNFTGNPAYELKDVKGFKNRTMTYDEAYKYTKANRVAQTEMVESMLNADSYKGMTWKMRASEVGDAHWTSTTVADYKTYGSAYALRSLFQAKDKEKETFREYKRLNGTSKETRDSYVEYYINKETMLARSHATGDDVYRVKGITAMLSKDENLLKAVDIHKSKVDAINTYLGKVQKELGTNNVKKIKDTVFKELTDGCCEIMSNVDRAGISSPSKGVKSVSAGIVAKEGNKIAERVYRCLGHNWNSAQAGAGLMMKYNKNDKYSVKKIAEMKSFLRTEGDLDKSGSVNKKEVIAYIDSLNIKNADEKACLYEVLYSGGNYKNPYKSQINDHLEWGKNRDDEWGTGTGSGKGWGHGWGHGHGGGGGSGKGKMPNTESGAIKGKVSNPFSNTGKPSNLDDAYRKKLKKLREQAR